MQFGQIINLVNDREQVWTLTMERGRGTERLRGLQSVEVKDIFIGVTWIRDYERY